jgi:hypothetical protein
MKEGLLIAMLKAVHRIANIDVEACSLLPPLDRRTTPQDYHLVIQKPLQHEMASPGIVLQLDLQEK